MRSNILAGPNPTLTVELTMGPTYVTVPTTVCVWDVQQLTQCQSQWTKLLTISCFSH